MAKKLKIQSNTGMRFLILILILSNLSSTAQSLSDKYLHFRTDHYWDTILYKAELEYTIENSKGNLIRRSVIPDAPYHYVRKGNAIYIRYYDHPQKKMVLHKYYSLKKADTVKWLIVKTSLGDSSGVTVEGSSVYLGEEIILLNNKEYKTFRFMEDHFNIGSHNSCYTEEVFLDQVTLIPIKHIHRNYEPKSRKPTSYSFITYFNSSGNQLPDYSTAQPSDLVIYENTNTNWTDKQKSEFLLYFPESKQALGECILRKLDGTILFYNFKHHPYFILLISKNECGDPEKE